ncbi:nucleotide-binding universal stress UspA family protein [Kitasatospora sp. MAA19]|uniref:universal stress protein n=1 Tax=unclassified Kitasatospora TaxID=2633591 RepID=UPI0024758E4A|nr:universal stress protein [Kitasatospora sp. MAA19]MDH6707845.1 nucleotide-binding universal stress UspA family protein [Kitasatospora sp. MAA19]
MHGNGRHEGSGGGRVVVGVSGSLGSLAALHRGVAEARHRGAELVPVLAWEPPGGEFGYRRSPCPPLLAAVREAAERRLLDALDAAFGGADPGVPLRPLVIRGETGPALVQAADRPEDLLVLGQSGGLLRRRLRGSVPAYCARKAGCPVLTVPVPGLLHELEAMNRRTRWHLPVGEMSELLFVKG